MLTYFGSRINPVEKLYASFPLFLFINSTYAGQLLSPLLEFQDTPSNNQAFAARDVGELNTSQPHNSALMTRQAKAILDVMQIILIISSR